MPSFAFFRGAGLCSYNATEMEFGERSYCIYPLFIRSGPTLSFLSEIALLSFFSHAALSSCREALKRIQKTLDLIFGRGLSFGKPLGKGSGTFSHPAFFCNRILCSKSTPSVDPPQLSGVYIKGPFPWRRPRQSRQYLSRENPFSKRNGGRK